MSKLTGGMVAVGVVMILLTTSAPVVSRTEVRPQPPATLTHTVATPVPGRLVSYWAPSAATPPPPPPPPQSPPQSPSPSIATPPQSPSPSIATPAPSPSPAQSAPTCGGQQTLVANGITWACTFDSEFTGNSLDTAQWSPVKTSTAGYTSGNTACFVDSPNNISVGNGYLSLTVRKEASPFICQDPYGNFVTQYTSGYVTTLGNFSQAYGRFEVNAKVPAATIAGLQSSFWLFPQDETLHGFWPASGEIDIAETYSQYPGLAVPYIHYNFNPATASGATNTNIVTNDNCTINPNQFNDYVVEWTPNTITAIYNGKTCLVDHWAPALPETASEPFNQPFFINLTQALGIDTNQFNPSSTPVPATTEVRYVRVWQEQP